MATASEVLEHYRPEGGWILIGEEFQNIEWIDCEPMSETQFNKGFSIVDKAKETREKNLDASRSSARAKLAALGLTPEEIASL